MLLIARILVTLGLSTLFIAYSNFIPTFLVHPELPGYIQNHFIREVFFGMTLSASAIYVVWREPLPQKFNLLWVSIAGPVVVLPFWIAMTFGYSALDVAAVWGQAVSVTGVYMIHVPQISFTLIGVILYNIASRKRNADA